MPRFAVPLVCLAALLSVVMPARAAFVVSLQQVGNDVVATGAGTINLSGLTFNINNGDVAVMAASSGLVVLGPRSYTPTSFYEGFTGPASFGGGSYHYPNSASGDIVGIANSSGLLTVPQNYLSGTPLAATATFTDQTFDTLGLTPGTYTWAWGTGPSADTFTAQIGPTPEPASLAVISLAGLALFRRPRRAA